MIGAGPAGLGAAYRAAAAGHRVVLLEREDHVGGLAASFDVAGVRVDHGSHRLHPATPPEILAELRRLLGEELQTRPRHGRIRLFGRWLDFPLRPGDLATSLPVAFVVRAAASAGASAVRTVRHGARTATFADHVTSGLGGVMGREFYFPYARKIWGIEPDQLSGEQARRRITAGSPARLLARVSSPATAAGRSFHYPAGGFGRISEVLAGAARTAGADMRLGHGVTGLHAQPDGVWRVTAGDRVIRARHVWSTVAVTALARMLGLSAPALAYRSMLLVYLVLERPGGVARYTGYDAHYLPSASTPVTRISEPANYRSSTADPTERTVLCAEIPCDRTDDAWSAPDDVLQQVVTDALLGAGLPDPRPVAVLVRRVPYAYPVYSLGYEAALQPLLQAVDALPGLVTFGRQGLFAHDNTHHALVMAWAAAACLGRDGSFDQAVWQQACARFTEHVVSD